MKGLYKDNNMIQGKLIAGNSDLEEVTHIRKKVFVEELGIAKDTEFDEEDKEAIHAIAYFQRNQKDMEQAVNIPEKIAVATGRIIYDGEECKIDKVAVLKEYRGKSYGDFIVRLLINKAFNCGAKRVTLNTQLESINFFRKIGFQQEDDEINQGGEVLYKMKIEKKDLVFTCRK